MGAKKEIVDIKNQSAKRLLEVRKLLKELKTEESNLKAIFTEDFVGEDVIVTISEATRKNLNKKRLLEVVHPDVIESCSDEITYEKMSVKAK